MHCSNCGTLLTQNLNYCQHCGSRNKRSADAASGGPSTLLISAAGAIGVVGLIVSYAALREMLHSPMTGPATATVLFAYLAMLFLTIKLLVGNAMKLVAGADKPDTSQENRQYAAPAPPRRATTAQLEPMSDDDMPISVTEHTTRTLEEVPVRRK